MSGRCRFGTGIGGQPPPSEVLGLHGRGIGLFLLRERSLAASRASSAVLFGRADPHRVVPRFTQVWNTAILVVVATVFAVVGLLILLGVVKLNG